jgi:Zn-finger nucleic acid-binding protein
MQCPNCHKPLTGIDYEGVHIEICPVCGGDWLGAGQLTNILKARQTRFTEQECLAIAQVAKITYVKLPNLDRHLVCPECGGTTHPINYGDDTGIVIDKCATCGGVWLDRGELDKIEELVNGWNDELPDDLKQYGPKLRQVSADVNADLKVHISHFRFVNAAINGVFDLFGE